MQVLGHIMYNKVLTSMCLFKNYLYCSYLQYSGHKGERVGFSSDDPVVVRDSLRQTQGGAFEAVGSEGGLAGDDGCCRRVTIFVELESVMTISVLFSALWTSRTLILSSANILESKAFQLSLNGCDDSNGKKK
ncbi:hypothetical protein L2E82_01479 [Cichorium intybus]|uniref:Uncharacterized protein n=1 Tax=Cichorium intybus TaxID=13427 RepID=A0ACB9GZP7_CICIN|nr:hypothetical protein L2E82_01479 [Cichorium intybus]